MSVATRLSKQPTWTMLAWVAIQVTAVTVAAQDSGSDPGQKNAPDPYIIRMVDIPKPVVASRVANVLGRIQRNPDSWLDWPSSIPLRATVGWSNARRILDSSFSCWISNFHLDMAWGFQASLSRMPTSVITPGS
jgi:hypothetical protein